MLEKRIGVLMYQTSKSKGQELVAQRMVKDFIQAGYKAYLITGAYHDNVEVISPKSLTVGNKHISVEDDILNIPVIRVDSYIAKWPPRRVIFRDFISNLEKIVDELKLNVLITHSTLWNGPEEVAQFVAWRRTMRNLGGYLDPLVYCHMSHFQEPLAGHYSFHEMSYRMAWNNFSLTRILETANLILCVTPYEKGAKIKMGAKPDKCFLFPGGVDDMVLTKYAAADAGELLKKYGIPDNVRLVSYLGSIEERKNPMAVLKVAEMLKDKKSEFHFVIAGRGDSPYAEKVKEYAARLPNVSYTGELTDKEKVQLFKASYINILLSKLEALGITQLEFMYYGVPVVTSAVGGQSWVVANGEEGIHVKGPEDIKGAARAITRLMEQPNTWKKMSENARKKAYKTASSKIITELDAAIDEALIKESGLMPVPSDVRSTLGEPEQVLRSWKSGETGIIATNRRLFVRIGTLSRRVLETQYSNIHSIEHVRRVPWHITTVGAMLSLLVLIAPQMKPFFSQSVISWLDGVLNSLGTVLPENSIIKDILGKYYAFIPFLVSLVVLLLNSGSGYYLYGVGIKPIYLSSKFREAITFIRDFQDAQAEKKQDRLPDNIGV
jgi:glycosyltransferase involved in cell wall biosynthesis